MDLNNPNNFSTYNHYDVYFKNDMDRYIQVNTAYEQFLGLCDQEAGGSRSGIKRTRQYIPHEREEAEQCLINDYFGEGDTPPNYLSIRKRSLGKGII